MKERSATTRSAGAAEVVGGQAPDRGAAALLHARVGRDLGDELAVADVDGDDVRGPGGEEHLGEPARRRPDVDAAPALDAEALRRPGVERGGELVRGSAHPPRLRCRSPPARRARRPVGPPW